MSLFAQACVAEIQGIDGPVAFPELLLQKIWSLGEFCGRPLETTAGQLVEVLSPGRWNRQAGPDFRGAHLRVGGEEVRGDVELHLRAEDWDAHRHAEDPAFAGVRLHVVLFPPACGWSTRGAGEEAIPTLVLLPHLPRDLESYALDDAAERLANRSLFRAREELALLGVDEVRSTLARSAAGRWQAKVAFARRRIERLGWSEACHLGALEGLGCRFNRPAMASVAARWPLVEWAAGRADARSVWEQTQGWWKGPWGRPGNHPLRRLQAYETWSRMVRDWPERLREHGAAFGTASLQAPTGRERRRLGWSGLRRRLCEGLVGRALSGPRLDTLVCDHFLPLLAADGADLGGAWFHWYLGDAPPRLVACARDLRAVEPPLQPMCNGWLQGLIGWCAALDTADFSGPSQSAI